LRESKKKIKIIKNSLKCLVETDEKKYINLQCKIKNEIEVLPDKFPIFCKLKVNNQKLPLIVTVDIDCDQDL
jgi:hypothetical protein